MTAFPTSCVLPQFSLELTHYRPAMPFGKKIEEDLFSSVLSQFKKISLLWKPEI